MLTHVVCFKFANFELAEQARQRLLSMVGRVPSLRELEAGVDVVRGERSYDVALITRFDDLEAMKRYQVDPVHVEVAGFLKQNATSVVAVDFES